ncbi:GNAT family N-acetyltransferase [Georgenia muralis]
MSPGPATSGTTHGAGAAVVREVAWDHPAAVALRAGMGAEIDPRYADQAHRLGPALSPDPAEMVLTLVAFDGEVPVACGSLRHLPEPVDVAGVAAPLEVKKLFVATTHRRLGLASRMLTEVTAAATRRGAGALVLHTGTRQPEAVALYEAAGWAVIPVYGEYAVIADVSLCFGRVVGPGG